ncbi:MAG: hypothetical protein ACFBSF_12410 [Leptolyngbyaceae cyanobacterium]
MATQTAFQDALIGQFDYIVSHFDGDAVDKDDVAALPIVGLLLNSAGLASKSTVFYNNNLSAPGASLQVQQMRNSAAFVETLGIATYDYEANATAATDALVAILNSGKKVLILEGGPMEATYQALAQVSPANRANITQISHGLFNEVTGPLTWEDIQNDFPEVTQIEIVDQNGRTDSEGFKSSLWNWLDSTSDPLLQEARTLMNQVMNQNQKQNDPSDAGMHFYALTGNEFGTPLDAQDFFEMYPPSNTDRLSLSIDPATLSENNGTATATITRTNTIGDLTITLSSDDTTEAIVPATVTIADGADAATFTVTGVNDAESDGSQIVTITATATAFADDTATVEVTDDEMPESEGLLLTVNNNVTVDGIEIAAQDIAQFNGTDYRIFFDGSDVGIPDITKVNAFDVISPNEMLLSFSEPVTLDGVAIDDSDVVKFTATSLGEETAGSFELFFDGSDLGLASNGEDINALALQSDGSLLISVTSNLKPGTDTIATNEDIALFTPTSMGENTAGTFELFFDGSDVGLGDTAVNGFSQSPTGDLIFSANDDGVIVGGITTENEDVLTFTATATGEETTGTFGNALLFDGSENDLDFRNVEAIDFTLTSFEVPQTLSISLGTPSIHENGGVTTATVTRTGDTSADLTVNLSSSDTSEASVPATVVIPAGETQATFSVSAVDDIAVDGTQTTSITATAPGLADGVATLEVTDDDVPTGSLLLTLNQDTLLNDIDITDQDIAQFDGTNFNLYFEGSDVGIVDTGIDAFDAISATEILLSFDQPTTLPGVGAVDDSDVVRFTASSLGEDTAGTFALEFDGSDVGLSNGGEDIDGLVGLPDGSLLLSINGNLNPGNGIIANSNDVVLFTPTSTGDTTAGSFSVFFDGSDVGVIDGGVDGLSIDAASDLFLSTTDDFAVGGVTGKDEDVIAFTPTSTGDTTTGSFDSTLFFDGSENGLQFRNVQGLDLTFTAV